MNRYAAARGDDPKVVVIDDHELFRSGVIGLLQERGIEVVGEAGLAADGIRQAAAIGSCVVLMDLNLPGMSGVAATQRLTAAAPLARVLVLTIFALILDFAVTKIESKLLVWQPGTAETEAL